MCYKDMSEKEKQDMDEWMDEMDARYLEDAFIEEAAAREAEGRYDYYNEF